MTDYTALIISLLRAALKVSHYVLPTALNSRHLDDSEIILAVDDESRKLFSAHKSRNENYIVLCNYAKVRHIILNI